MTSSAPSLAVVIPNFNYARFLPHALESAFGQTEPFDEIVVVDDGSTDESLAVLDHYTGRARIISIPNSGPLGACRAGFAATSADYIYFLDSDDFAAPDLAATVRVALQRRPVKLQFQLHTVDTAGALLGSLFPIFPPSYDAEAMRRDNLSIGFYQCPPTSGNVFSRTALARMDLAWLDPRDSMDGTPALAAPYLGEVVSLNRPLAHYRVHGHSESSWSRPSVALLQRELDMFHSRWQKVVRIAAMAEPPFSEAPPLYVSEREMLIACLQGRRIVAPQIRRFVTGLVATHVPLQQKIMLSLWSMGLIVPSGRLRQSLIRSKRSAANRSRILRSMINFVTRARLASL
jgi:hypothetical protein